MASHWLNLLKNWNTGNSDPHKNKFNERAKEEALKILRFLGIDKFEEDTGDFIEELDCIMASLVNEQKDGEAIDDELLEIYDLLTEIVLDNE